MYKIAINGFGRIGRNILRALYERPDLQDRIQIVAINDLGDASISAHLLQVRYGARPLWSAGGSGRELGPTSMATKIQWFCERDPANIPWGDLGVDLVCECTGVFTSRDKAALHIAGGAKKVLISAPGSNVDATVVYGINHSILTQQHQVISNASCTTNCLAPLVKPLHEAMGI